MILAEASNGFMGQLVYAVIGLLAGVASVVAILAYKNRNESKPRRIEPNPLGVKISAKRYNHDLSESRYSEITRRLEKHDEEILGIQNERAKSLHQINGKFDTISETLRKLPGEIIRDLRNLGALK